MTAGSNQHGSNHHGSNHHAMHPRDDRESLSALFDGELPRDAARFALKRLDHDVDWRDTCGRWQLVGDALRGEATAVAPPYFAAGVMDAIGTEAPAQAVPGVARAAADGTHARPVSPRRWIGGMALAATVAMAAVLVVRPYSQQAATDTDPQIATSTTPASTVPAPSIPAPATDTPGSASAVAAIDRAEAPIATGNAAKPRGPGLVGSGRAQAVASADRIPARTARRARSQPAPVDPTSTNVAATAGTTTRQPFHPPADEITTRPWPRSVLPDTAAEGSLTVGFGSASNASPSFYPFEPRLPASETPTAADARATDPPQR